MITNGISFDDRPSTTSLEQDMAKEKKNLIKKLLKKKLYKLLINHMIMLCNMRFPTNALSTKASRKLKLN
jgi:hypothetical protein